MPYELYSAKEEEAARERMRLIYDLMQQDGQEDARTKAEANAEAQARWRLRLAEAFAVVVIAVGAAIFLLYLAFGISS